MTALATGTSAAAAVPTAAAVLAADWKYWLPPQYSSHGDSIDLLFVWIFWITTIIFIVVELALVWFLIKYRERKDGRRAVFTHGNTRLEMAWTLMPAVILIILALATKRVWDRYRYSKDAEDPNRAQILVVGEQFKWNFVFPGPDQQLGTYLDYPQTTDKEYRHLPFDRAKAEIGKYINDTNPLGQKLPADRNAPDPGRDDDYARQPGRPLIVPVDRPIDIHLTAKDVLHDFFLPTFRVKLDAVPGMRGHIYFKGESVKGARSTEPLALDKVPDNAPIWLDQNTPGVIVAGNPRRYRIQDPATATRPPPQRRAILDSMETLAFAARRRLSRGGATPEQMDQNPAMVAEELTKLKADLGKLGVTQLSAVTKVHEIVCEELCGLGHATMRGEMIMVSNDEYMNYLKLSGPQTATTPTRLPAPPTTPAAAVPTTADASVAAAKE